MFFGRIFSLCINLLDVMLYTDKRAYRLVLSLKYVALDFVFILQILQNFSLTVTKVLK